MTDRMLAEHEFKIRALEEQMSGALKRAMELLEAERAKVAALEAGEQILMRQVSALLEEIGGYRAQIEGLEADVRAALEAP